LDVILSRHIACNYRDLQSRLLQTIQGCNLAFPQAAIPLHAVCHDQPPLNPSPAWFAADITGRKFPSNHAVHVRSDLPFSLAPGSKAAETPHDQPLYGARGLSRLSRCSSRSLGPIAHSSRACKPRHSALIACTQLPMLFVRDDESCCWSSSQYTTRIFFPVNKRTNFLIP
jgi:hypothetical protein